jgi:SSS family solute:Na+ symporter
VSTDDTYLHSWGSIFIQDVLLPFRKERLDPQTHIRYLRRSILGVAVFAWVFSMLFPLKEYIFMFFAITGAIFVGGAGAAIIGGLYGKRGTTGGAWAGMITGSALAVGSIVLSNIVWPLILPGLREAYPEWALIQEKEGFPIHGAWLSFIASMAAAAVYVVVSLLSRREPFNMDRMLHRGAYAVAGEHVLAEQKPSRGFRALGMGPEFTRGDRAIYILTIAWVMFLFTTFVLGTVYSLVVKPFSDEAWINWWLFLCIFMGVTGVATTVWFLWGGFRDLKAMFRDLRSAERNELDDGTVVDHQSLADRADTEP